MNIIAIGRIQLSEDGAAEVLHGSITPDSVVQLTWNGFPDATRGVLSVDTSWQTASIYSSATNADSGQTVSYVIINP